MSAAASGESRTQLSRVASLLLEWNAETESMLGWNSVELSLSVETSSGPYIYSGHQDYNREKWEKLAVVNNCNVLLWLFEFE